MIISFSFFSLMNHLKKNYPDVLKDEYFINEFLEILNVAITNDYAVNDWNDLNAKTSYLGLGGDERTTWHRYGYKTFFDILLVSFIFTWIFFL